jgi:hypothetical protein
VHRQFLDLLEPADIDALGAIWERLRVQSQAGGLDEAA